MIKKVSGMHIPLLIRFREYQKRERVKQKAYKKIKLYKTM